MREPRSLYDSYRLSNSSAIPLFEGSAGPEAIQVGQQLQGQYDIAQEGAGQISSASDNVQAMPQDQAHADELRSTVRGTIDKFSRQRDWENRVGDVSALGRTFASRAMELQRPIAQYQQWKKDELENKDKNLTTTQKADLNARALAGYSGLKKDNLGRLVGSFTGIDAAKNIDIPKWTDEKMKDITHSMGGTEIATDNGEWKVKRGDKWDNVDKNKIESTLAAAIRGDTELQDFMKMESENAAFKGGHGVKSLNDVPAELRTDVVTSHMTPAEAMATYHGNARRQQILSSIKDYAVNKYAMNNRWTINDTGIGELALDRGKKAQDDFRIAGAGPNTIPAWATDPGKLTKEISDSQDQIKDLNDKKAVQERLLKTDPTSTSIQTGLDRINKQIEQTQSILDNNSQIWNHTRDQAVQDLKLSDSKGELISTFKQFQDQQAPKLLSAIKKDYPTGITVNKVKYSPEQLTEMAFNGKINKLDPYKSAALRGLITEASGDLPNIEKQAHDIHSKVSQGFSTTSNTVGLNEEEQKTIGDFGISSATIYAAPGSNKIYTDKDVRSQKFIPEKFSIESNRITGRFKDDKGVMTEPMDVEMNTNMRTELRSRIAKKNVDGKWNPILMAMDDASYTGPLSKVKPGTVLTGFPDANGLPTNKPMMWGTKKMHLVLDAQGNDREWVLTDTDGNAILDKEGQQYRTPNISEANAWIQQMGKKK